MANQFVTVAAALVAALVPGVPDRPLQKAIWGPVTWEGRAQAPLYRRLRADLFQYGLSWAAVAPERPADPSDPADPAYRWPSELDDVVRAARTSGFEVSIMLTHAPRWANGNRARGWAPSDAADFAQFAEAAARRYPQVRHWMVWGEPTRRGNFEPGRPGRRAARRYAELLDAAYIALKRADLRNLVIGGNTWTAGTTSPADWLRWMRLPDGDHPRLDLYGHNPFTRRRPRLADPPLAGGAVDFGTLDEFAADLDRAYPARKVKLFLSEFTVPTDQAGGIFNFSRSREVAADWLRAAFAEARSWNRVYALGWFELYDDPPTRTDARLGLLDHEGRPKPAYRAYREG